MTRSTRILSPLAVVGLIIVLLVQTPGINAKSDQSSLPSHTPFHTPRGPLHVSNTFSYAVGIPAIHPRSVSNSPNTPSFTAEDAQAYMLTASQPKLTPVQGIHLTIE